MKKASSAQVPYQGPERNHTFPEFGRKQKQNRPFLDFPNRPRQVQEATDVTFIFLSTMLRFHTHTHTQNHTLSFFKKGEPGSQNSVAPESLPKRFTSAGGFRDNLAQRIRGRGRASQNFRYISSALKTECLACRRRRPALVFLLPPCFIYWGATGFLPRQQYNFIQCFTHKETYHPRHTHRKGETTAFFAPGALIALKSKPYHLSCFLFIYLFYYLK